VVSEARKGVLEALEAHKGCDPYSHATEQGHVPGAVVFAHGAFVLSIGDVPNTKD